MIFGIDDSIDEKVFGNVISYILLDGKYFFLIWDNRVFDEIGDTIKIDAFFIFV